MSPQPQTDSLRCPQCGAPNTLRIVSHSPLTPTLLQTCWSCHAPLPTRQLHPLPADPRDRGADPDDRQKEPQ